MVRTKAVGLKSGSRAITVLYCYLSDRLGADYSDRDRGVSSTGGVKLEKITKSIYEPQKHHLSKHTAFLSTGAIWFSCLSQHSRRLYRCLP